MKRTAASTKIGSTDLSKSSFSGTTGKKKVKKKRSSSTNKIWIPLLGFMSVWSIALLYRFVYNPRSEIRANMMRNMNAENHIFGNHLDHHHGFGAHEYGHKGYGGYDRKEPPPRPMRDMNKGRYYGYPRGRSADDGDDMKRPHVRGEPNEKWGPMHGHDPRERKMMGNNPYYQPPPDFRVDPREYYGRQHDPHAMIGHREGPYVGRDDETRYDPREMLEHGPRGHRREFVEQKWGKFGNHGHGKARLKNLLPEDLGDTSKHYQSMRQKYDQKHPDQSTASLVKHARKLRKHTFLPMNPDDMSYDVFDCPDDPPPDYPFQYPILDVLDNWNPDDPEPRTHIYQGICIFDFETEYDKAVRYREAELPFVIRDDPEVLSTVQRWSDPDYLKEIMQDQSHRAEYSNNNHFMYWSSRKGGNQPKGWIPPTENIRMTYPEWLSHANITDDSKLEPGQPHWYFRLIGCGFLGRDCDKEHSEWLFNELTFFKPTYEETLYMTEPLEQKGIHCRFGMKGVIAENHFDATRNMIAVFGGERRYILSHPENCKNLYLHPRQHPSGRHSAVNWADPDLDEFPQFADASVNEIVLQAGDVLYLPTYWFHFIISLDVNYQCNARSGVSNEYTQHIRKCGF